MTDAARTVRRCLLLAGIASLLFILSAFLGNGSLAVAADQFGVVSLQLNGDKFVPGNLLEATYSTSPGTLSGKVDIYFSLLQPTGQLLFLQSDGTLSEVQAPFRSNVTMVAETKPLFSLFLVYIPFGTYTASIVMLKAGGSLLDPNAYVSTVTSATFSFTPLSQAQQALIGQRGNPELLITTWVAELHEKQDVWLYLSSNPTQYIFLNGGLQSQTTATGPAPGPAPKLDPSLLTPQTTLDQLTALFGSPTTIETAEEAPDYQTVTFAIGLQVVLFKGRLSAARTFSP